MSEQVNHTPGPWEAVAWRNHAETTVKAGDIVVAECGENGRDNAQNIPDARLIAAAPDLLEACKAALVYPQVPLVEKALRKAISKSEGRAA